MKTSPLFFIVLIAFSVIAIAGCTGDGGGIPVDEQRVRDHIIKIEDARRYKNNLSKEVRDSLNIPNSELFTRDAIAVDLEREGRVLRLFDTAGLRRKTRVEGAAEELSVGDTLKAIKFAEIVVLLLDAECPFEKQDLQIADLVVEEGRALVIAVNKWDLVRAPQARLAELREACERLLPQVKGVAFVPVSALTGKGVDTLLAAVIEADALWNKRLPTHALNQWLREAVDAHSPPAVLGRRIKLRYITQSNARPPTFVLFCSRPKALPDSYVRYLVNSLRETFDLPGVPIRLHLRKGDNPYA